MMKAGLHSEMSRVIQEVHINMPWQHLPRYLELVLEHRFNVEIGLGAMDLDALSRTEARSMAEKLHKEGIRISLHGPFWDLCAGSTDPLIRQITRTRLQQFFDLVAIFQPLQVVCHTGYDPRHHGDWQRFLEISLATWEPLVERAELLEVPLLLENVWEHHPRLHQELFYHLSSPYLGFCLDVGHQHCFSRTPLSDWLKSLGDRLREIHLHDNDGNGDTHLPVGQGSIDFDALFQAVKQQLRKPLLTLEPHRESHLFQSLRTLTKVLERCGWFSEEQTHGHCGSQYCSARNPHHQPQPVCGQGPGGAPTKPAVL
jgi:sugar phosphate isomerase/epimerase